MAKSVLWLLWKEPVFQGDYFGGNSFLARYCSRSCFATRWFERKKRRDTVETLHNGFLYLVEQTERWPWYQEKEEETRSSFDVGSKTRERRKRRRFIIAEVIFAAHQDILAMLDLYFSCDTFKASSFLPFPVFLQTRDSCREENNLS